MKFLLFAAFLVHVTLINALMEAASTTVQIQNYEGPIYIHGETQTLTCDNSLPTSSNYSPTCDNHHRSIVSSYDKYPTSKMPTMTSLVPCYDQYPTLTSLVTPLLHGSTSPNHQTYCETDCKCISKHQTSCLPVNNVLYSCTPCYTSQYPEGYGYGYPDYRTNYPEEGSCPKISETLIPMLKTYLSQSNKSTKPCQQCGHNHSSYY